MERTHAYIYKNIYIYIYTYIYIRKEAHIYMREQKKNGAIVVVDSDKDIKV